MLQRRETAGSAQDAERLKARRSLREDALNIPNLLTFGRVLVIPIVLLLLDRGTPEDCLLAALVYSAAALTEQAKGSSRGRTAAGQSKKKATTKQKRKPRGTQQRGQ